jgi:hypothetical protein
MHKMSDGEKGGRQFLVRIGRIGLNAGCAIQLVSFHGCFIFFFFWEGVIDTIEHAIK